MSAFSLDFAGISQVGKRSSNQDAFVAKQLTSDVYLFAVADGMGGAAGGELASAIVIESLEQAIQERLDILYDDPNGMRLVFGFAIDHIQKQLANQIDQDYSLNGMGSTLTALLITENQFVTCNIGDSRIYLRTEERLVQLTKDHSYVQEMMNKLEAHEITAEFIAKHENIITRVLNGGSDIADISENHTFDFSSNNFYQFLLCSDGLILDKRAAPNYIEDILRESEGKLNDDCMRLSNHAFYNGSSDNITCVLVSAEKKDAIATIPNNSSVE